MSGPVIMVAGVGAATGSRAAAAALACLGSDQDRAGLVIDLADGRPPRPTLIASAPARALEERLAAHLPDGDVASRGLTCHLRLPGDRSGLERIAAALPIVRDSIGVVHLPPRLMQPALAKASLLPARGALLRADLSVDRALAALAVRDLIEARLRVAVLKRPLGWIASRRALTGLMGPAGSSGGLPPRLCRRLLGESSSVILPERIAEDFG